MIKLDSFNFGANELYDRWEEKIVKGEPFIRWGADNLEPQRLIWYTDYSPIHNACIKSIVDNARGRGLVKDYKINNRETLNDVIGQIYWEYVVSGNLFLEVIWKKDRREGIHSIHVIPSKFMRIAQPKNYELETDTWYYSRDWVGNNWKKAGLIELKEFSPDIYEDRQVIHVKNYQGGYNWYGSPGYASALLDVRLSHSISQFNLSNISNGASPSLFIHLPDSPPDSQNEQENILARFEERYVGSGNAGRIILSWGGVEGQKPEITQIAPTMQTGGYAEIFGLVRENIMSAHKIIDGSIIGLPSPTGFNSSAEQLETTFKLFMSTTVKPLQKFILDEIKPVLELMYPGEEITLEIEQNTIL
jgi:hypothetical protein